MITWEDKEDVRQSNLPRKNRITADDMNEIKREFNRVKTFDAIVSYSGIVAVGVNDIGSVVFQAVSNVITLSFTNAFINRIVTVQATNGSDGNIISAYYLGDGDTIEIVQTPGVNIDMASITIKSYPND